VACTPIIVQAGSCSPAHATANTRMPNFWRIGGIPHLIGHTNRIIRDQLRRQTVRARPGAAAGTAGTQIARMQRHPGAHPTWLPQTPRAQVAAFEVDRALYRAMKSDQSLPLSVRQQVQRFFETELPRDSSVHRVTRRCALTGRSHGVYRHYRLSRLMFRRLAAEGLLPGVRKATW